jgi:hypothetical protein
MVKRNSLVSYDRTREGHLESVARWLLWVAVVFVLVDCASAFVVVRWAGAGWTWRVHEGAFELRWWSPIDLFDYGHGIHIELTTPSWTPFHFAMGGRVDRSQLFAMPIWASWCSLVGAVALVGYWRRARDGVCPKCGYSQRGLTCGICPECGGQQAGTRERLSVAGRLRRSLRPGKLPLLAMGVAIALTSVTYVAFLVFERFESTETVIAVPDGYRGAALIVYDADATQPQQSGRKFTFVVPPSGIVRSNRVDILNTYGGSHTLVCREKNGRQIPLWHGERDGKTTFHISGPSSQFRIYRMSVGGGDDHERLWIPVDEWEDLMAHGVPLNYVVPHEYQ